MTDNEILPHIDHTLLRPTSTAEEIDRLCEEALRLRTASVCIPPSYVKYAHDKFPALNICTVIGFPLGYNGDFDGVQNEISDVRSACPGKILKVIVETCYLTEDEKIRLCECVTNAGADYIKTSTGFGTAGAKLEDIRLFAKHIGGSVKMKAAGGVKSREDLEMFLEAGCDRIGTSSAVKLLNEK